MGRPKEFRDWRQRMRLQLGRRGAFLLAWGLLFILYGIGLWFQPLPTQPRSALLLHEMVPGWVRAVIWVVTGLVACWSAFARTPYGERFGFYALALMPLTRAASYLVAFGAHLVTPYGDSRGWVSAAFYAVLVATIVIVAGWANNDVTEDHR